MYNRYGNYNMTEVEVNSPLSIKYATVYIRRLMMSCMKLRVQWRMNPRRPGAASKLFDTLSECQIGLPGLVKQAS